jgi:hypothetical protein
VRIRLAAVCIAVLALPLTAGAASPPFKIVFRGETHTPKVNQHWHWSIAVTTNAGKPLAARISAVVIDPVGGVHPVEYSCCAKKFITNVRLPGGTFKDWVTYPLAAKGYRIVFRLTVKTALGTRSVSYWIKTV